MRIKRTAFWRGLVVFFLMGQFLTLGCSKTPPSNPFAAEFARVGCRVATEGAVLSRAWTQNDEDLNICFGYLHGRYRSKQMDYFRRVASGRLAEVRGWRAVTQDFKLRLLRLEERAKRLFEGLSLHEKRRLWAYAYGVNQTIDRSQMKPWEPHESLMVLLLQSFDQTKKTLGRDLQDEARLDGWGSSAHELFSPYGLPWSTSIMKRGEYEEQKRASRGWTETPKANVVKNGEWQHYLLDDRSHGSNNWVLGKSRTRRGRAFLANDPHLRLTHPSFWFLVHLQTASEIDVVGVSLPGVPLIVSGANRSLSWGLTNSYVDVADVRQVKEENLETEKVWPVVWFKWGLLQVPIFFKSFEFTANGKPVLPIDGATKGYSFVLNWSGFDVKPSGVSKMLELMRAGSIDELDEVLREFQPPSWNFVFADRSGAIGYRTVGLLPKRSRVAFGAPPVQNEKEMAFEYLNASQAPHLLRPERDWVVTANNLQWGSRGRHAIGRAHSASLRAFRIEELLAQTKLHSRRSQELIQCDQEMVDARFLLPALLSRLVEPKKGWRPKELAAIASLRNWNYAGDADCRPCSVYQLWLEYLFRETDLNIAALYRELQSKRPQFLTLEQLQTSLQMAVEVLSRLSGEFPRPWGELHRAQFSSMGDRSAESSGESIATGGGKYSVNPGAADWNEDDRFFNHHSGASWRMIAELTSPPTIYFSLPGGRDENTSKDFKSDDRPWKKWARCEFSRLQWPVDWKAIRSTRVLPRR